MKKIILTIFYGSALFFCSCQKFNADFQTDFTKKTAIKINQINSSDISTSNIMTYIIENELKKADFNIVNKNPQIEISGDIEISENQGISSAVLVSAGLIYIKEGEKLIGTIEYYCSPVGQSWLVCKTPAEFAKLTAKKIIEKIKK